MTNGRAPDEGINGAVAAVLRGERAAMGITIAELSERSGVPVVTVQRLLAGRRPFTVAVLDQLAYALGRTGADVHLDAQSRTSGADEELVQRFMAGLTRALGRENRGLRNHQS